MPLGQEPIASMKGDSHSVYLVPREQGHTALSLMCITLRNNQLKNNTLKRGFAIQAVGIDRSLTSMT